jgi:phage nucleotide-binding protein
MKVQSTQDLTSGKIKVFVYGFSGAGKTTLAKTLSKCLVISAESGLLSLKGTKIPYIDISQDDAGNLIPKEKRIDRLAEVYRWLLSDEAKNYDWIMLDSLTEVGQCLSDRLSKDYPDRKDALVKWGEYATKMRDLVKSFRDLPCHNVVINSLAVVDKDENGKRFAAVDLQGSISQKLAGYFDLFLFLNTVKQEDGTIKRELICGPEDGIAAKDRSGRLASREPADLSALASKVMQ